MPGELIIQTWLVLMTMAKCGEIGTYIQTCSFFSTYSKDEVFSRYGYDCPYGYCHSRRGHVFVNVVGIKHYNECDAIRGVEKFENRKVYLTSS